MSDDIAIKVEGVSKNFRLPHEKTNSLKSTFLQRVKGGRRSVEVQYALKNINLEIKRGEFFGIVGRNGSGKSTLLKILAQIYKPTSGNVSVRGRLVPFIELGVGFNPELTGRDNVYLSASLLGFSRKEIDRMYKNIVEFAELEKFMDQKLKNYSSGMQVRLAFSIATRVDTDILLIDEVLAVGDADFQRKCFDYFKQLKKNKKTVVFVSHDMSAIREYCDRVVLIEKALVVEEGLPDEVAAEYSKLFMGDNKASVDRLSDERWGTGEAQTVRLQVESTEESIIIRQLVRASVDMENPIVGFRVTDASGKEILGTNSYVEGKKTGRIISGREQSFVWEFDNILSDGTYSVDPAVLHEDAVTVCDWWNGAAQIIISKERHLPYAIDPGFSFEIEKK